MKRLEIVSVLALSVAMAILVAEIVYTSMYGIDIIAEKTGVNPGLLFLVVELPPFLAFLYASMACGMQEAG